MSELTRRNFIRTTSVGAAAGLPLASRVLNAAPGEHSGPNLLFVLADQWRASALGIGSDEVVRTPNIDRLAGQGAGFTRAYAANPVCTPNRSCILTGRHSHQHGMIQNNLMLPPSEVCWPELFRDAGYATHYVGKWHMDGVEKPGFVPPGWRRRGFETFEGFNRGHVYHEHWGFDNEGQPLADKVQESDRPYYEPTLQTDLAIDFMKARQDRPFCCYLSWGPPHTPFRPPESYRKYTASDIRLRPNVPDKHRQRATKDLVGYYGLCESLDHEMGRLMSFLDDSGLADNTLVVFSADHGELAGSHGKYRKGEPEDESLRVPLVMRLPGRIDAGQTPDTLFNSIDLMPSMLSLCGLDNPGTCTGRDLSGSVLADHPAPDVESVYCQGKVNSSPGRNNKKTATGGTWRTIVTDQYKLTVRAEAGNVEHLFDVQNDPFELENLADDPKHRSVRSDLLAELRAWGKRTDDPFPERPAEAKSMYSDEEAAAIRDV